MIPPRRRGSSLGLRLGVALVAVSAGGCAIGAEKVVRRTTPAMIESGLETLSEPEVQAMVRRLLDKAEVREAMHELTRSLSTGLVDGLSDEERAARLGAVSERFVQQMAGALGDGLRDEITPHAQELVAGAVRQAMAEALSPGNQRRAEEAASGIARRAIEALITGSSTGLRGELGPALAHVVDDDLGPALAHVLDDDLGPALERLLAERLIPAIMRALATEAPPLVGALARETSRQMVLGVDDALVELDVIDPAERGTILRNFSAGLDRGLKAGEILAWIFAILAILLGLWLIRTLLRNRDLAQEKARSDRVFAGLLEKISQRHRGEPWIDDVLAMAQETLREVDHADPLRDAVASSAASPSSPKPPPSPKSPT